MNTLPLPDAATLMDVTNVTWPAAATHDCGPFTIRDGQGGGSRVSSAMLNGADAVTPDALNTAEAAMQALGQKRIFQIIPDQSAFDAQLEGAGYRLFDPVTIYAAPIGPLADRDIPRVRAFTIWEPLAIQIDIWAAAGIGADRIAVMKRATCPKTSILGRLNDHPAGTAYVGLHNKIAMIHALEILPHQRKQGMGGFAMAQAARWGRDHGATHIALVVRSENGAANALYTSLGMEPVGRYHYRIHPDD